MGNVACSQIRASPKYSEMTVYSSRARPVTVVVGPLSRDGRAAPCIFAHFAQVEVGYLLSLKGKEQAKMEICARLRQNIPLLTGPC